MKQLLFGIAIFFIGGISAQTVQQQFVNIQLPANQTSLNGVNSLVKSQSCGPDTNGYTLAKASGLQALSLNNATSASAASQYFDAPQALSISGVSFYSYKIDATGGPSLLATVSVYAAAPDSTPLGAPLATTAVLIDTTFAPGTLDVLRKHATFTTPITVNSAYVVVVSNPSPNSIGLIYNSWTAMDGGQEWLTSALIGTTWLRGYELNIGGSTLDADALMEPHVSYVLNSSFTLDNPCLNPGLAVNFTNASSPVLSNRMYNIAEFIGSPELSYTWNYGDASATENMVNASHTYASAGSYGVTLTDTLFGWTSNCSTDTMVTIGSNTVAGFTSVEAGLNATFTNTSTSGSGTTYAWDFGDGNTSTVMSPAHSYASAGTYTVCLIVTDACGADTLCSPVTVICAAPTSSYTFSSNQLQADFTSTSVISGTATYAWDFGDGNTSTLMNPSHTYATDGSYTACLIVTDDCGADTTCQTVAVMTSGLSELTLVDISVYPNPSKGNFAIEASAEMVSTFITDLSGKLVYSANLTGRSAAITTNELATGTYFLSIRFADGMNQTVRLEVVN